MNGFVAITFRILAFERILSIMHATFKQSLYDKRQNKYCCSVPSIRVTLESGVITFRILAFERILSIMHATFKQSLYDKGQNKYCCSVPSIRVTLESGVITFRILAFERILSIMHATFKRIHGSVIYTDYEEKTKSIQLHGFL